MMKLKERLLIGAEESFTHRLWWGSEQVADDDTYEVACEWTEAEDEDAVVASDDPANYWFLLLVAEAVDD